MAKYIYHKTYHLSVQLSSIKQIPIIVYHFLKEPRKQNTTPWKISKEKKSRIFLSSCAGEGLLKSDTKARYHDEIDNMEIKLSN